ncbi:uncharacterized protein ACWYII_018462 isoform 2-T2 [Salvelinus alpinus]
MYKVHLTVDNLSNVAVERRLATEAALQARIFKHWREENWRRWRVNERRSSMTFWRLREIEKQRAAAWDFQRTEQNREDEEEERKAMELQKEERIEMDLYDKRLAREQHKCLHQSAVPGQAAVHQPTHSPEPPWFSSSSRWGITSTDSPHITGSQIQTIGTTQQ